MQLTYHPFNKLLKAALSKVKSELVRNYIHDHTHNYINVDEELIKTNLDKFLKDKPGVLEVIKALGLTDYTFAQPPEKHRVPYYVFWNNEIMVITSHEYRRKNESIVVRTREPNSELHHVVLEFTESKICPSHWSSPLAVDKTDMEFIADYLTRFNIRYDKFANTIEIKHVTDTINDSLTFVFDDSKTVVTIVDTENYLHKHLTATYNMSSVKYKLNFVITLLQRYERETPDFS